MCWDFIQKLSKNKYSKEDLYKTGIYRIENLLNSRCYIGSAASYKGVPSQKGFYYRWGKHIRDLNRGDHRNCHLQRAWNKYGIENFEFSILEFCSPEDCIDKENEWFLKTEQFDKYNQATVAGSLLNYQHSFESRMKKAKSFLLISPEGKVMEGINLTKFAEDNNLSLGNLRKVKSGSIKHYKGWTSNLENHKRWKEGWTLPEPRYLFHKDYGLKEVKSVRGFAKEYNLDPSSISKILLGKKLSTKGWSLPNKRPEKSNAKTYRMLTPDNKIIEVHNLSKFCKENNLNSPNLVQVLNGFPGRYSHKGFRRCPDTM